MVCMSSNAESPGRHFGERFQMTNCILDLGANFHLTPEISDFVPGSLSDRDKYIEVSGGHLITSKTKVEVCIKICDDNGKPSIATIYNFLPVPDLCNSLFSVIMLMNLVHTCLFRGSFCMVFQC